MKMKILAVITIILLGITSFNVLAVQSDNIPKVEVSVKDDVQFFSNAEFETNENYISVKLDDSDSYLMEPGKPMLPVVVKTFTFPFGTKIKDVTCKALEINQIQISGKIKPAPNPVSKSCVDTSISKNYSQDNFEDKNVYSSSEFYPNSWYDYDIRCGLKDNKNVIVVTIKFYPLRYSPLGNILHQTQSVDIKITYEKQLELFDEDSKYDMVVIAPEKFSTQIEPLIEHKNDIGVRTVLKTTESIYKEARQGIYGRKGRDRAEKVKLFIYWAKENWDIKYVLLVGGKQAQSLLRWHVPVRYSNLDDEPEEYPNWETSYLSDLYFADIYRYNKTNMEYEFEDWDSNGNNVFAEWTFKMLYNKSSSKWVTVVDKKDVLDLYPDVHVGRLACRNRFEVRTAVNKIISYETSKNNSEWFNNFLLIGGDTFPPADGGLVGYYEGEIITNLSASYMNPLGFNITKLWVSTGAFTEPADIIQAINSGAGFVHFSGHGSPLDWATHPTDTNDSNEWVNGLITMEMRLLNNSDKLPIVIVGACHSSQFDVSLMKFLTGFLRYRLRYFIYNENRASFLKMEWIPRCWSWNLVRQKQGGAIAVIGNTGLGYEYIDEFCITGLGGWLESHFFKVYSETEKINQTLGRIYSQAISDYVQIFSPNDQTYTRHRKTVEQWILLGDPSLKIGDYS